MQQSVPKHATAPGQNGAGGWAPAAAAAAVPPVLPSLATRTHLLVEVHASQVGAALLVHRHRRLLRLRLFLAGGACHARVPQQLILACVAGRRRALPLPLSLPLLLPPLASSGRLGQHPVHAPVHLQQLAVQQLGHGGAAARTGWPWGRGCKTAAAARRRRLGRGSDGSLPAHLIELAVVWGGRQTHLLPLSGAPAQLGSRGGGKRRCARQAQGN